MDELFGFDGRHRPLPTILPTSPSVSGKYRSCRCSTERKAAETIIRTLEEMFDSAGAIGCTIGGQTSVQFVMFTWKYGRIEVDIFKENVIISTEADHRHDIISRLNRGGFFYQIIGEEQLINIRRKCLATT